MDAFGKGKEAAMADKGVMVMGAGGKPTRLDRVDGAGVDLRVVCEGDTAVSTLVGSILVGELAAFQAGLGLKPASSERRGRRRARGDLGVGCVDVTGGGGDQHEAGAARSATDAALSLNVSSPF